MIRFNNYRHVPLIFNKKSTYETKLISSILEMYEFGNDILINEIISDLKETIKNGAKHTDEIEYKYLRNDKIVLATDNEMGEITVFYDIESEDDFSMVGFMNLESLKKSCT